jgi:4-hydroxymandelate oxidase
MRSALEDAASRVLPPEVFAYYATGSGDGVTVAEEEASWGRLRFRPRVLRDVSQLTTSTTVLGASVAAPVMVAPTATQALAHPDGEVATARGAKAMGCLMVLSMRSSRRLEDVASAAGSWWQQVYVLRDRGISDEVVRRAAAAGAAALVLTVDTPYVARKVSGRLPVLPATGLIEALDSREPDDPRLWQAADVGVADIARLADASGLPVVVKGVLRGDEAVRCLDAGVAGVVVSSHGGRQLDGVIPVPQALAEVVGAIDGRCEVYVDGGVRSGRDVLRALAVGARAALLGRPVLWALAAGGSDGVRAMLDEVIADLRESLALAGCQGCDDVGPDLVCFRL